MALGIRELLIGSLGVASTEGAITWVSLLTVTQVSAELVDCVGTGRIGLNPFANPLTGVFKRLCSLMGVMLSLSLAFFDESEGLPFFRLIVDGGKTTVGGVGWATTGFGNILTAAVDCEVAGFNSSLSRLPCVTAYFLGLPLFLIVEGGGRSISSFFTGSSG